MEVALEYESWTLGFCILMPRDTEGERAVFVNVERATENLIYR